MNTQKWQTPAGFKADGSPRRIGIEIEMGGLSLRQVTGIVAHWANSPAHYDSVAQGHVDTRWGKLSTEIDWGYLKKAANEEDLDPSKAKWLEFLEVVVNGLVPTEIALPPIPLADLHHLEPLVHALRAAGAKGTTHSPLAAFGIHLNPELPNLDASTIIGFIQAFGLLQWWLVEAYRVDFTRRLAPYIDLYPQSYILRTLAYDQMTTVADVRADYLTENPTRNRALDLWPLFAYFDADWVAEQIPEEQIKARPTLHFRMPNCEIDNPDWQIWDTWQPWYAVEHLAHNKSLLAELASEFNDRQRPLLGAKRVEWVEYLNTWLKDRSLA